VEITCLEKSKCAVKVGYVFWCVEISSAGYKVVEPLSGTKVEMPPVKSGVKTSLLEGDSSTLAAVTHAKQQAVSGRIQKLKAKAALQP
jgi:hypothetical protein